MQAREILIALAIKHQGNWDAIYRDLQDKNIDGLESYDTKVDAITILDEDYPNQLKQAFRPPFVLFYKGNKDLLKNKITCVTGDSDTTSSKIAYTLKIVNILNENNITIINGFAKGIDTFVMGNAKKCICVLGYSFNHCYPVQNMTLMRKIAKTGLLLTEYPSDTPPTKENLLFRHRIIAALSEKIAIISLSDHSSILNCVSFALQQNKEIHCRPDLENDDNPCNNLIYDGAYTLITGKELL